MQSKFASGAAREADLLAQIKALRNQACHHRYFFYIYIKKVPNFIDVLDTSTVLDDKAITLVLYVPVLVLNKSFYIACDQPYN
jgi:hypothetical protein